MMTRRGFGRTSLTALIGCSLFGGAGLALAEGSFAALPDEFARIESDSGGRLGVAVLDAQSGALVGHRAGERFPMCSTFELLAAAATLGKVDAGGERLDRRVI
jgi:beta-lactamase class A